MVGVLSLDASADMRLPAERTGTVQTTLDRGVPGASKLSNGVRMTGSSNVGMCLYDGHNLQSTWFDMSTSDGRLTVDRGDQGRYLVLIDSDKSGSYESRVDYTLNLAYAGKKIAQPNNVTVRLRGVNNSVGRAASLTKWTIRKANCLSPMVRR